MVFRLFEKKCPHIDINYRPADLLSQICGTIYMQ